MSKGNKRYVVLQDAKSEDCAVSKSRSFTLADSPVTARYKYSEVSRLPRAKTASVSEGGDMAVFASGVVDPQFTSSTNGSGGASLGVEPISEPREVGGQGLIQTGGSVGRSRYVFAKDGQQSYQLRSTYNGFNKTTQGLERNINTGEPDNIYCRPALLPLANGNLLCGYLDNKAQPWAWNWQSNLILNTIEVFVTDGTNLPNLTPGDAFTSARPSGGVFIPLNISGIVAGVDTPNDKLILTVLAPSGPYTQLILGRKITVGAYDFTVANKAEPVLVDKWINSPSGAGRWNRTIRLRLQTSKDRMWSTVDEDDTTRSYASSTGEFASSDALVSGGIVGGYYAGPQDRYIGITGLSFVQFPDTKEVLVLYVGFKGRPRVAAEYFNPGFLCVDALDHDLETLQGFAGSPFSPINRGTFTLNQPYFGTDENVPTDVAGLYGARFRPLDMTAEVLPSGRLVVVVLFEDSLWSLVSDDRGVTFSANLIIDLTFPISDEVLGEEVPTHHVLRLGTVNSTSTKDGRIAIIVCCNGLGDRGFPLELEHLGNWPEAVLSIFVSADGTSWGREKKLGRGLYEKGVRTAGTYPETTYDSTYQTQALYALSASITLTPEGTYLVSAVGYNQGGPGNAHSQQLYQRVLEVDELLAGQDGEAVASTLPPQIYDQEQPFKNEYQQLVMSKYQPSIKVDDSIGGPTTDPQDWLHAIIPYYLCENMAVGSNQINASYLGQLYFANTPLASASGWLSKGGGPLWSQGPIDINTCLWRDSVVTVSCGLSEFEPVDYPNSIDDILSYDPSNPGDLGGPPFVGARRESYVEVLYSGGFQPLSARVPNNIRWWARGFTAQGRAVQTKLPGIFNTVPVDDLCQQLGGNGWQVTYNAPRNPYDQAWEAATTGSATESFIHAESDNKSYFRGLLTVAGTGDARVYSYAKLLSSAFEKRVFPNYLGEALSRGEVPSGRDFTGLNNLGFTCRVVVAMPWASQFNASTEAFSGHSLGALILLQRDVPGGYEQLQARLRVGRDVTQGITGIQLYDPQNFPQNVMCTIQIDDPGNGSSPQIFPSFYEILFCADSDNGSNSDYYGTLAARKLDPYGDPDQLNDFTYAKSENHFALVAVVEEEEQIKFGIFDGDAGGLYGTSAYWSSFQFSRNFLDLDTASLSNYRVNPYAFSGEDILPKGMEEFSTPSLILRELPIDSVRLRSGGLFTPSSPSSCSSTAQMLDGGIKVGFLGRSGADDSFTYEAASTMATENIFKLPSSVGWRSLSDTVTFAAPNLLTPASHAEVDVVPDYEIELDFGSKGVLPESVAFFGINTDEICVDFYDSPSTPMTLTGVSSPSLSAWFSSPGGAATKLWNSQAGTPSVSVEVTYKPNYLFYWENYSILDGSPITFSGGDLIASLDAGASPNIVRFKTAGYDSATPSVAQNQGRYAPFIPNQFRSQSGESYYLVVYSRNLAAETSGFKPYDLDDWDKGDDCKFRHIFKIKDNGSDHLILTSDIASTLTVDRTASGGAEDSKIPIGSMTIISDRVASNLPDFFPDVEKDDADARQFDGMNRYRFMRLRVGGGKMHDPSENFLQIGMMIAGSRISLGSPDIAWGWSYDVEFGNSMYTGVTGQRRSKKNHRPRRSWEVSYAPRPSEDVVIRGAEGDEDHYYYENPSRGYGRIANSVHPNNTEQMSERSKMSWMEAVQRVLTLEVDGDVMALAFEGDNMVNNHSLHSGFPSDGSLRPAASSPHEIVAARLVGYGGASHEAYQSQTQIGNQPVGESVVSRNTSCRVRPVVAVSSIKLSEEL